MTISEIRFIIGTVFIVAGLIVFLLAVIGVFKISRGISRLHAAAMGDSSGIFLVVIGAMIIYGNIAVIGKLFCILAIFWLTSPVCSHLVAMLEADTDDGLEEYCKSFTLDEVEGDLVSYEGGIDHGPY